MAMKQKDLTWMEWMEVYKATRRIQKFYKQMETQGGYTDILYYEIGLEVVQSGFASDVGFTFLDYYEPSEWCNQKSKLKNTAHLKTAKAYLNPTRHYQRTEADLSTQVIWKTEPLLKTKDKPTKGLQIEFDFDAKEDIQDISNSVMDNRIGYLKYNECSYYDRYEAGIKYMPDLVKRYVKSRKLLPENFVNDKENELISSYRFLCEKYKMLGKNIIMWDYINLVLIHKELVNRNVFTKYTQQSLIQVANIFKKNGNKKYLKK